jgi:hypothetical protein
MNSPRPAALVFSSLAELYSHFESLFLSGKEVSNQLTSDSGLTLTIFDHNFFHMVKLTRPNRQKLFMKEQKALLRAQTDGFGEYQYDRQRAIHLPAARQTLEHPDEVYEEALRSASYVFIKEYSEAPYPFTVVLTAKREGSLIVPVTSFPCRRRDIRKWRKGRLIYQRPQNTTAAE